MIRRTTMAILVLVASCNPALAQRAVVCPPHLSYCYEKPVYREQPARDAWEEFKAGLDRDTAAVQQRLRDGGASLDWQLERALWLRR
jgi:hypothetical protein